ncbi:hypothetical protein DFH27DRAFT_580351 [Peziza echinospora]|nr:hypothetical protein DFH27DRAFT_580351 [Peziza echinospora]
MAQGALKKVSTAGKPKSTGGPQAGSARKPKTLGPRPGRKVIAPKNAGLVMAKTLNKRVTASLIVATEKAMASKAGHLELLKGGKKERREKEKEAALAKAAAK